MSDHGQPPSGGFGSPPGGGQPPGGFGGGPPGGQPPGGFGGAPPPGGGGFGPPSQPGYGQPPGGPGFGAPGGGGGMSGPGIDPLALVSLGVSFLSLITCFCCSSILPLFGSLVGGAPVGLVGIGLGAFSLTRIKKEPDKLKGKELAFVGIGLGAVSVLLAILSTILLALGVMGNMASQY